MPRARSALSFCATPRGRGRATPGPPAVDDALPAPTLLIVGGEDGIVVELNRESFAQLHCEKSLGIVPGATHLFEEPGALEQVMVLARDWFARHFATLRARDAGAGRQP